MRSPWERNDWVPDVELPHSANEDDSWELLLRLANEAQDIAEHVDETLPDIDDLPPGAEREARLEQAVTDLLAANDRATKALIIAASVAAKLSTTAKARPVGTSAKTLERETFLREIAVAEQTAYHLRIAACAVESRYIARARELWPEPKTKGKLQQRIENFASRIKWTLPTAGDIIAKTED